MALEQPICAKCKGRGWCGRPCPILQKIKHWRKILTKKKEIEGPSPPGIFVGRFGYPKVWTGLLIAPESNSEIYEYPELWYKRKFNIRKILELRGSLVYARSKTHIREGINEIQEAAASKREIYLFTKLKKNPRFRFYFGARIPPTGNPAEYELIELLDEPKIENKVERVIADDEMKAKEAVIILYKKGIPVSRIQRIFSAGLLGLKIQRKFVPTRWSITAVDKHIGDFLLQRIREYPEIDDMELYTGEYIGNKYTIALFPSKYQYELIEIKYPGSIWNLNSNNPIVFSDYEPYWGRTSYASSTGGAFYAGRLAVLEALERRKRQASILIIREVKKEFYAPVGIWQMRECIRDMLSKRPKMIGEAVVKELKKKFNKVIGKSILLKNLRIKPLPSYF